MSKNIILSLILITGLFLSFVNAQKEPPLPSKGVTFNNFDVTDLNKNTKSLYERYKDKDKIIILNLFATWCPPCRMEIPGFISLQRKYTNSVIFVGLSFDRGISDYALTKFVKDMNINYDILRGTSQIAQYVRLSGIPRTFILMPDFTVVEDLLGGYPEDEFEPFVKNALSLIKTKKK